MKENHQDYSFAQNIIADLIGVSTPTITRTIKGLKLKNVNTESIKVKKYSVDNARLIAQQSMEPLEFEKKVHVFYNLKGGTGKTSICSQVASHLAIMGFNILVIDCDPQAHLTSVLGYPEDGNFMTMYDVLINGININDAIENVMPGLDAILSNISLSRVEVTLSQRARREEKLYENIKQIADRYDFILLDTNPSFSTLNLNALFCADQVNFVCETAPFSLYGLRVMLEETISFFDEMGREFIYKIIPNKYESKTATAQEVLGYLRAHYKESVMDAVVRKCEDINIASKERKPVAAFCKRKSIAFEDIVDLLHEFLNLSKRSLLNTKMG